MLLLVGFIWILPVNLHALINCPPRRALIDSSRDLVGKVAFYDDIKPVDAKTFADQKHITQSEIEKRFSGSGVFTCEDGWGNGQVVGKNNTVVTVRHTLSKPGDCRKPRQLSRCAFIYKEGTKTAIVYARKIIATGTCNQDGQIETGNDWAIVELEKKLPKSIKPYGIPKEGLIKAGQPLDLVGRTSGFNPNAIKGDLIDLPKSFASCTAVTRDTFKFWGDYQSNCPAQPGSSGSGVFLDGEDPKFAGLMLGDMDTQKICIAQAGPSADDGPFEKNCRGSLIVPVEGKFLSALQAVR